MLESHRQQRGEVTEALRALEGAASELGARSLADRVKADLVEKLVADRFHLVVVGEFNHGKTTFVNALLGRIVLPAGVTPTTAVIHQIEHGDPPSAEVVLASGERRPVPFDDVRRFAVGGGEDAAKVARLDVRVPAALLEERIVLVDTPGVNDLSLQRSEITYEYIPRADAVLFLLDAGQPLKESERVFLHDKLLGQSRDKILFVVTKADIWSSDEREEALAYVHGELAKLVKSPVVFPVSAERALEGERASSGIDELLSHLTKFLADERGRILLGNALGEALDVSRLLSQGILARRRAAAMTTDELARRIAVLEQDLAGQSRTVAERRAAVREEVAAIKAWARRDLEHFVTDVIRQIPDVVERAPASELKLHLGPFLEKTFRDWAEAETQEIAKALEALAEKTIALVRDDARDVASRVSAALGQGMRAPKVEVDTLGYDVGVVALLTVGLGVMFTNALLGGLLTVAAPLLAVYTKGKVEAETKRKAKELAPEAVRDAAAKVGPKLDELIDGFAARLDEWLVTAGEELHREVIEVLQASQAERARTQPSAEEAVAECDRQAGALSGVTSRLEALRASLG